MQNNDYGSFEKTDDSLQPKTIFSKGLFRILAILAISASIIGFFMLLAILTISIPQASLLFPHGFLMGMLLLSGGLLLLLSLIILVQESKRSTAAISSQIDQDNQNPRH